MSADVLSSKAAAYLQTLCRDIPGRRVGSAGNRMATDFFEKTIGTFGFETQVRQFNCLDWGEQGADLRAGTNSFDVLVSPYSPACQIRAPMVASSSFEELQTADIAGKLLLLHGEIAREQLMPKNFPFYNPDEHRRIYAALESKQPLAVLAATSKNPEMVGAVYPFPLIEDGDFEIPSVYMTAEEGRRLLDYAGVDVSLEIRAQRRRSTGCNIIARKGSDVSRRLVSFAHIDAKEGTPGAIDNASGVAVLLLLAELLSDYSGDPQIELVAMNGEDYYSNPGEQLYLRENAGKFEQILLGINLDGVGYFHGDTSYSMYDCPDELSSVITQALSGRPGITPGDAWYQGDHVLFLLNQRPALAFTSDQVSVLMTEIVHTAADRPEIVASAKLVEVALALRELLERLAI